MDDSSQTLSLNDPLLTVIGVYVAGDLGDLTVYTNKNGRIIWFPRSPPTKPPTEKQIAQRNRFKRARQNYDELSESDKESWEELCRLNHLDLTGQNAYLSLSLLPDD